MNQTGINSATGVNYDILDAFKRRAQQRAAQTDRNLRFTHCNPVAWSRGESAYLFEMDGRILGHVHEGLGTKNLVADALGDRGNQYWYGLAQDTVAMGVNDLLTLGLQPIAVSMHLSAGSEKWFENQDRAENFIAGWGEACDEAGCTWSCGETPQLEGIIVENTAELSCSVVGIADSREHVMSPDRIEEGDAIIFLASSGIHANGLTRAREVASKIPEGYETLLSNGKTFGDALLTPTIIYAKFLRACQGANVIPHYGVNVTGHGLRKLMRAPQSFCYQVDCLPDLREFPEFLLIQESLNFSNEKMYAAYNMGVGFALYVPPSIADTILSIAARCGIASWVAGTITSASESTVRLREKGIVYKAETLRVR